MSLSKGIQSAAAAALSAAMLIAVAACGTTDGTDTASKSGDSSKDSSSTSIQGFDTSSIQKDDEIAALLPDSVAGDGTLTVAGAVEKQVALPTGDWFGTIRHRYFLCPGRVPGRGRQDPGRL